MTQSSHMSPSRKPLVPKLEEVRQSRQIRESVSGTRVAEVALRIKDNSGASKTLTLPPRLGRFVLAAISEIAGGNAVSLLQIRRELTTHEAAEILNYRGPI